MTHIYTGGYRIYWKCNDYCGIKKEKGLLKGFEVLLTQEELQNSGCFYYMYLLLGVFASQEVEMGF